MAIVCQCAVQMIVTCVADVCQCVWWGDSRLRSSMVHTNL